VHIVRIIRIGGTHTKQQSFKYLSLWVGGNRYLMIFQSKLIITITQVKRRKNDGKYNFLQRQNNNNNSCNQRFGKNIFCNNGDEHNLLYYIIILCIYLISTSLRSLFSNIAYLSSATTKKNSRDNDTMIVIIIYQSRVIGCSIKKIIKI